MALEFNADAILLQKIDGKWVEETVNIKSVADIRNVFSPYQSSVGQINLSKYKKIYFTSESINKAGVDAMVYDEDHDRIFMGSKLLIVECDDVKPISITNSCAKSIKDAIDFY